MNFKKRIREVEDQQQTEKIRDRRPNQRGQGKPANNYDEVSPGSDEAGISRSPANRNKRTVEIKSPGVKNVEKPGKKTQIQTMKVNMKQSREVEEESSPKYNPGRHPRRYSPKEDSLGENSEDESPVNPVVNRRNRESVQQVKGSNNETAGKKGLHNKSKSTAYIPSKREQGNYNTVKETHREVEFDDEEEIYHYKYQDSDENNNNSGEQEEENFDEEEEEEKQSHSNHKHKLSMKRQQTMFKPTVDRQGKLLVHNVESINPVGDRQSHLPTMMQKMNRLSTILMSKSQEPAARGGGNNSNSDLFQSIDSGKRNPGLTKGMFGKQKSGKGKFISITLAMLSSKGPNCEDRVFTRDMRVDKGGVVDLVQQQNKKPVKNYQIKKITNNRSPSGKPKVIRYNPKEREKAAKLVQFWWREILNRFKLVNQKITKIQAHYRGSLVRSYIFELLYFSLLAKNFVEKFEEPIKKHAARAVFKQLNHLFGDEVTEKFNILKICKLQKFVKIFLRNLRDKRMKFNLVCEKIKFRYLKPVFNKLKEIAPENNKKYLRSLKFLNKVARVVLKNQFKEFLKDLARYPIKKLEERIKTKILKTHIDKMWKLNLREALHAWENQAKKKYNPTVNF